MSPKSKLTCLILLMLFPVAACSSAPIQIASFPKTTAIAQYPSNTTIVYRAYLELMVANVDQAADRATRLASDHGGYLVNSKSWYTGEHKVTTLEFAVPKASFEALRYALHGLGDLISETISGQPEEVGYNNPSRYYSYIILQLRPGGSVSPPIHYTSWNPLRTFQSAFSVFLNIFGFLVDILIWIIVVAGPFILIALVVFIVVKRLRKKSK